MTTVIKLDAIPTYDVLISKRMVESVAKQGLIEPIILLDRKTNEVHPDKRELYMAYRRAVKTLGDRGRDDIIVVWWDELTKEDKLEWRY